MIPILERSKRKIHGVMFKLPGMITCDVFESFILAYLDDELPPKQRRLFEIHLLVCRSCRRYLAAYRRTLEETSKLKEDAQELANVPEDLVSAILATRAGIEPDGPKPK